jgi:hypothetical protein
MTYLSQKHATFMRSARVQSNDAPLCDEARVVLDRAQ